MSRKRPREATERASQSPWPRAVALATILGGIAAAVSVWTSLPDTRPKHGGELRVEYYRLGGSMAELAMRGLLDQELGRRLAGAHETLNNEVFVAAGEVFSHFSRPVNGDEVWAERNGQMGVSIDLSDYLLRVGPQRRMTWDGGLDKFLKQSQEWRVYLGGNKSSFFLPDVSALHTFLDSDDMPSGYGFYHSRSGQYDPTTSQQQMTPLLWRPLVRADLDDYAANMRAYAREYIKDRDTSWAVSNFMVDGLRWLSRGGLPKNFLIATGMPAAHWGWEFYVEMPGLEMEFVLLENIGTLPMEVGELTLSSWGGPLRRSGETDKRLANGAVVKRPLTPSGLLAAGERILIPTRISFRTPEQSRTSEPPDYKVSSTDESLVEVPIGSRLDPNREAVPAVVYKRRDRVVASRLPPPGGDRFDFGPAWALRTLMVNGVVQPIREADYENGSVYFGSAKGSCPYVFTRGPSGGAWINRGHMLFGATSADTARSDLKQLGAFDGTVALRELENEVSVIHAATLVVRDSHGVFRELDPTPPVAFPLVIGPHESVAIEFEGYRPSAGDDVQLRLAGYYRPFALANVEVGRETKARQ